MLKLKYSSQYKKDLKKCYKRNYDISLIVEILNTLLSENILDPKYKDHELKGDYDGFRECHIFPDWLLIYNIDNKNSLLYLVRTGTHSDLF